MMMDKKTLTILGVIIGVIAIAIGIYFYVSREHMVCELITNSDYIRKNFRSMMDSPQIIRPQARGVRSLMRSSGLSGNYILLALNFSNPIASNFSVDIIGDNNAVLYKSKSVTQDINGTLVLFEADNIDSTKIRYFRLNNFNSNQNRVTRVVFGKYENGNMSLDAVSKCFVQYEANTNSTSVVPMLTGIQSIRFLAKNNKGGKIGQIAVKGGNLDADLVLKDITSNGVSDLDNLTKDTKSSTRAIISANGSFTFNSLKKGRLTLSYVDKIVLRNVSDLFPLIISFNYGKYIFDLVYNPIATSDVYNIEAESMSAIYDYEINALRISFNSILTGSSSVPTPTPVPTPPEPVIRSCDKTNFRVTEASSCDNVNGVWKRKQFIDYQDDLCQDESRYVDCPANMIPQPQPQPPQPTPPQPSVCPIDAVGLSNLRNTINNLENMMRQKDTTISDLRNQLSSQTCPPQQACPVTQEQYNQAINQFNMIQNQLQEKIREYNTLQDDLRNNYISKSTYEQHASQCVREIETLKKQLLECENKINNSPTPFKNIYLDGFINIINNLGSSSNVDDLINYLKKFYNEVLANTSKIISIETNQLDNIDSEKIIINSKCRFNDKIITTTPEYSLCNSRINITLQPNTYLYQDEFFDNKFSQLFKTICLIGYAYTIHRENRNRIIPKDVDEFGFALFILSIRYGSNILISDTENTTVSNMFEYIFIRKRTDLWKKAIQYMTNIFNPDGSMVKSFYSDLKNRGFDLLKLIYGFYISPVPTVDELLSRNPDNVYFVSLVIGGEDEGGLGASIENILNTIRNDSFVFHYYNEKYSRYNNIGYNYAYIFGIVRNDNYNNDLESKIKNIDRLVAYNVKECYNKNYISMYGSDNNKQKIIDNVNSFGFFSANFTYSQVNDSTKLTSSRYIEDISNLLISLTKL